jgi:hypothetical protein
MATARQASCSCGQLRVIAEGDPIRVSVCHCLACQRRTGSVFGAQARFPADKVRIEGQSKEYVRISDEGEPRPFHFCPECGSTVYYYLPIMPDAIAIPVGAFADPDFPQPTFSIWESRRHAWVTLPSGVEHHD